MERRLAAPGDIGRIMEIVAQAQDFMKSQGLDQWQDGYPHDFVFLEDIRMGRCHLLTEGGVSIAVFTVSTSPEKCYEGIRDGKWLTDGERYAVVHRAAVSSDYRRSGIGAIIMSESESIAAQKGCVSVRVDTHRDNRAMRRLLERCGYTHCGMVFLEGPEKPRLAREAYEKLL